MYPWRSVLQGCERLCRLRRCIVSWAILAAAMAAHGVPRLQLHGAGASLALGSTQSHGPITRTHSLHTINTSPITPLLIPLAHSATPFHPT